MVHTVTQPSLTRDTILSYGMKIACGLSFPPGAGRPRVPARPPRNEGEADGAASQSPVERAWPCRRPALPEATQSSPALLPDLGEIRLQRAYGREHLPGPGAAAQPMSRSIKPTTSSKKGGGGTAY